MNQVLRKFVPRAPRYVLRPNDQHLVRFSKESSRGPLAIHTTEMINISETGMAIIAPSKASPRVGERIKIELPVPGELGQIAWWGRVVRVELYKRTWWTDKDLDSEDQAVIGIRFEDLPKGHRKTIRRGLEAKLIESLKERRHLQLLYFTQYINENWLKAMGIVIAAIAAMAFLYFLAQPDANYDPKKGSPWGHRYKFLDFDKDHQ